jgi:multidrug transporter EmrE-like cation transporter
MIVLNTLMLGTFLEGMEESGSVAGTGLATASNFATSALLGVMLWQEKVDQIWIIGFTLVVSGVLILSRVQSISEESAEQEKKRL